jgi:hypothetical protein
MLTKCENNSLKGCTRRVRGSFEKLTPISQTVNFLFLNGLRFVDIRAKKGYVYFFVH